MALTETWLKTQHKKIRAKELVKADRDGLSARVSPKGKITYSMRYYYNSVNLHLKLTRFLHRILTHPEGQIMA